MKRLSLYLFLLLFTLQPPSWADDIRDFEIEGMSVRDSLLDYFNEEEIQKALYEKQYTGSDKFKIAWFPIQDSKIYPAVSIHYKNDGKYIIHSVNGEILYKNKMKECYKKQKIVVNDISNLLSLKSPRVKNGKMIYDKSGKSTYRKFKFKLDEGIIDIMCTNWSLKIEKETNWVDSLRVYINTNEFMIWMRNEAFE